MTDEIEKPEDASFPLSGKVAKISRGALQAIGGTIPFAGGVFSAIAGAWSEGEQDRVNRFFEHWVRMLQDELKEKEQTIIEIMARLNLQDEAIAARVESKEYQSLVKKTFGYRLIQRANKKGNISEIFYRMLQLLKYPVMMLCAFILIG